MYATYALLNFNMLPSVFVNLPIREKATVIAMIEYAAKRKKELERSAKCK